MEQLAEMRALPGTDVNEVVAEQVNCAVANSSRHVVIDRDTRQLSESAISDANRGLLRKATDAIFNFPGYHRVGKPFHNRLRD